MLEASIYGSDVGKIEVGVFKKVVFGLRQGFQIFYEGRSKMVQRHNLSENLKLKPNSLLLCQPVHTIYLENSNQTENLNSNQIANY